MGVFEDYESRRVKGRIQDFCMIKAVLFVSVYIYGEREVK